MPVGASRALPGRTGVKEHAGRPQGHQQCSAAIIPSHSCLIKQAEIIDEFCVTVSHDRVPYGRDTSVSRTTAPLSPPSWTFHP